MRTRLLVALAIALVCSAAGCSAVDSRPSGRSTGEPAKDPDLRNLVLPLDSFDLTAGELETVTEARYSLTQRCVRRFGERLPARKPGRLRAPRTDRYGLADERLARTWAYSQDAPIQTAVPWEATVRPGSTLYDLIHGDGTGKDGCRSEDGRILARGTRLHGGKDLNPIPALDDQAWRSSLESARVEEASEAWRRCMAKDGYSYENPVEAPYFHWGEKRVEANPRPTKEQRRNGIRPTAAERRAALSDVRCKHESGFLRAWVTEDVAAQERLIETHEGALRAYRRSLDTLVRNATAVVRGQT